MIFGVKFGEKEVDKSHHIHKVLVYLKQNTELSGFFFLGLHLQQMEFPRPEVELEPQLKPIPQPQQLGIQDASATYTRAQGNTGSLTH